MAEVVARAKPGAGLRFASAGVAVERVGAPADPRAMSCVAAAGLDLTQHRTRAVSDALLASAQRVFALDRSVRDQLYESPRPIPCPAIELLASLIPNANLLDIEDPWHGSAADYAAAFALIERAVDALNAEC